MTFDAKDAVNTPQDQRTYDANQRQQAQHAEATCPKDVFKVGGRETAIAHEYLAQVRIWLDRYKSYPAAAQQAHQQGHAVVRFTILGDGKVINASVLQSSHVPVLDQAALRMLHDASPLPKLPCKLSKVTVTIPVDFALGQQQETLAQQNAREFPCVFNPFACGSEGPFTLLETTHLVTQDIEKQVWGYAPSDQVKIIRTFDTRTHCLEARRDYTQYRRRITSGTRSDAVAVVTYTCALPPAWQEIDR